MDIDVILIVLHQGTAFDRQQNTRMMIRLRGSYVLRLLVYVFMHTVRGICLYMCKFSSKV